MSTPKNGIQRITVYQDIFLTGKANVSMSILHSLSLIDPNFGFYRSMCLDSLENINTKSKTPIKPDRPPFSSVVSRNERCTHSFGGAGKSTICLAHTKFTIYSNNHAYVPEQFE